MDQILIEQTHETLNDILKDYVTRSQLNSDLNFESIRVYTNIDLLWNFNMKLKQEIKDLKSKQTRSKVSPAQQRAEILRDRTFKEEHISSRRAMEILGIGSRMQAIRAMKKAAATYDDLFLYQKPGNLKNYTLQVKALSG